MNKILVITIILILNFFITVVYGSEKFYQEKWCKEHWGVAEQRLPDRTRVDCLTALYAVEVEFAAKYKEAVGQSLHYSMATGKRAGIVLIMGKGDRKYLDQLMMDIRYHRLKIKVWLMEKVDEDV